MEVEVDVHKLDSISLVIPCQVKHDDQHWETGRAMGQEIYVIGRNQS